ncbi:MAG TPA: SRPBCC domain-containing protein [Longimicrobiaceae bacterium]|nr:SRPBCC domain-containing protein [Longimicrobiaceae bacterium]
MTTTTNQTGVPAGGRVSADAVREATGRGWDEWFQVLDAAGAADLPHGEIVAVLRRGHPGVSGWWQQSITVEYERARGKRVVGQTADAGFQLGVQRSVAATVADAWELITTRPGLWLGEGAAVDFAVGERSQGPAGQGAPGASGEVRVVKPGVRLRMTWQPEGWAAPATLQLTLTESGPGRTVVGAHLEKLPDAEAREAMRARWRAALERIAAALG